MKKFTFNFDVEPEFIKIFTEINAFRVQNTFDYNITLKLARFSIEQTTGDPFDLKKINY
ncbi:MAG: hypothetical protein HWN65_21365 [Candidatus Helarchaeota archaeon]|nr:hypothetical protein [Candidatus Helarchaeota archaeon]